MRRARHILAVTLVATALCADRAVMAAPVLRPQTTSTAGKLVSRLSNSFRRVVPSIRVYEARRDGCLAALQPMPVPESAVCPGTRLSPLLLRLPPPVV